MHKRSTCLVRWAGKASIRLKAKSRLEFGATARRMTTTLQMDGAASVVSRGDKSTEVCKIKTISVDGDPKGRVIPRYYTVPEPWKESVLKKNPSNRLKYC